MKNQSGTIKTNPELDRVVMGGSGGYRRKCSFFVTHKQTLHHNIYIILIVIVILIFILILIDTKLEGQSSDLANCISSACKQLDRVPAPSPICRLEETFPIFVFVFVLLSLTLCLLLSPILMTTSSTNRKTCDFSYMQRHTGWFF